MFLPITVMFRSTTDEWSLGRGDPGSDEVAADEALVSAVRDGRPVDDEDPVTEILLGLRACGTGTCGCAGRTRCVVRDLGRPRR